VLVKSAACQSWRIFLDTVPFSQCFDTIGGATGRASGLQKDWLWFVGDDDFTGALLQFCHHDLRQRNSNKIQNGVILVPVNPGPPGIMAV